MNSTQSFASLRQLYPLFTYHSYDLRRKPEAIEIAYHFSIDGLCDFTPTLSIETQGLEICNDFDSPAAQRMVFALGMVELVSYWKCACPPQIRILCGGLDAEDLLWWKKLYYNGLGEFFYRNGIETTFDSFVSISACAPQSRGEEPFTCRGWNLIPVGGGKDSNVTMELLREYQPQNRPFLINPRGACLSSAYAAGYCDADMIKVHRTIDSALLARNREGFLNGHTPFSAIVAFTSLYCAYLTGGRYIALSNESSANEGNIEGLSVNHQYSKSYEFECDFNRYAKKNLVDGVSYFSLLRPFNELQIARQFTAFPQYFPIFKSCNAGSKADIWCGRCPKCLFVYGILSPFLTQEQLDTIFGGNLLDREELLDIFDGLVGFSPVKPFECVGTQEEITLALAMTAEQYESQGLPMPALLRRFASRTDTRAIAAQRDTLLCEYNREHLVPPVFQSKIKEMLARVSAAT